MRPEWLLASRPKKPTAKKALLRNPLRKSPPQKSPRQRKPLSKGLPRKRQPQKSPRLKTYGRRTSTKKPHSKTSPLNVYCIFRLHWSSYNSIVTIGATPVDIGKKCTYQYTVLLSSFVVHYPRLPTHCHTYPNLFLVINRYQIHLQNFFALRAFIGLNPTLN